MQHLASSIRKAYVDNIQAEDKQIEEDIADAPEASGDHSPETLQRIEELQRKAANAEARAEDLHAAVREEVRRHEETRQHQAPYKNQRLNSIQANEKQVNNSSSYTFESK
ncbi:hypothetical protein TGFOU_314715 [Toxoplasma gondii FOU]|uniref:Uncharacterized protein n=3 Tax=Toxoplasma gondii TaxID=5811 RepID=A0A086LHZ4_TOXGO|nr:hypothetical protein TGFOU_314715 [Toxoplasma gondii FOU]PUA86534.1 hypothetical protein TGBR9_314715 [Toxoplasma gondii TgCATBr9]RQX70989.1 hypothetical protein TGCAST_314715 [Toxoplasma gondii CAST]